MSNMTPQEMARHIGGGLLSFPVTPFKADYSFDEGNVPRQSGLAVRLRCGRPVRGRRHRRILLADPGRSREVVRGRRRRNQGPRAGAGRHRIWHGDRQRIAVAAEQAGADGLLLLPPYLIHSEQDGLAAHVEAVCAATRLGVIVYNRDNAMLNEETLAELCDRCPNLVGYKDGVGDIELMTRVYSRMGDRLTYVGGLPTAETFALPYLDMGVTTYSSAVFNFVPEFATAFYAAVRRRDHAAIHAGLRDFILPLDRHPQPQEGLCGLDHQGGHEGHRPGFRPRAPAIDGSDRERACRTHRTCRTTAAHRRK